MSDDTPSRPVTATVESPAPATRTSARRRRRAVTTVPGRHWWLCALAVVVVGWTAAMWMPVGPDTWWAITAWDEFRLDAALEITADRSSYLPLDDGSWNLQPWLAVIGLGWMWDLGGATALAIAGGALLALAGLATWQLARIGTPIRPLGAAWVAAALLLVVAPTAATTSLVALPVALLVAIALRSGSWWAVPVLTLLWAQLDASVVLAPVLALLAAVGLYGPGVRTWSRKLDRPAWRGLWVGSVVAATLVSPLGPLDHADALVRQLVAVSPLPPSASMAAGMLGVVLAAVIVGVVGWKRGRLSSGDLSGVVIAVGMISLLDLQPMFALVVLAPAAAVAFAGGWTGSTGARHALISMRGPALAAVALVAVAGAVAYPGSSRQQERADAAMPVPLAAEIAAEIADEDVYVSAEWADRLGADVINAAAVDARPARFSNAQLDEYDAATDGDLAAFTRLTTCPTDIADDDTTIALTDGGGGVSAAEAFAVVSSDGQSALFDKLRGLDTKGFTDVDLDEIDAVRVRYLGDVPGGGAFAIECRQADV